MADEPLRERVWERLARVFGHPELGVTHEAGSGMHAAIIRATESGPAS